MDVTVGDFNYRIGKLNPRKQLHIARRLAPVLGGLAREAIGLTESKLDKMNEAQMIGAVAIPITEGLSKMREEDVDYILDTCLGTVSRIEAEGKLQPVMNAATKQMQYEDLDLGQMMQLAVHVVQHNLGRFLPGQLPK